MSEIEEETTVETPDEESTDGETAESDEFQLSLQVEIKDVGPCKKHVTVRVPHSDIDHYYGEAVMSTIR